MNPYAYRSRQSAQASGQPAVESVSGAAPSGSLMKSIFSTPISTAISFAMVIFAAGSVASMTALAYPELNSSDNGPIVSYNLGVVHSQVLGDATSTPSVVPTINDSALEASTVVAAKISAKPVSYDSTLGRWDYTISYKFSKFSGTASLNIGTYVLKTGITGSGSADTGAILKPSTTYHVTLWISDASGNLVSSVHYDFRTSHAKTTGDNQNQSSDENGFSCAPLTPPGQGGSSGTPVTIVTNGSSTSTLPSGLSNFCIKKDDGSISCRMPLCMMHDNRGNDHGASSTPTGQRPGGTQGQNFPFPPPQGSNGSSSTSTLPNQPPFPTRD